MYWIFHRKKEIAGTYVINGLVVGSLTPAHELRLRCSMCVTLVNVCNWFPIQMQTTLYSRLMIIVTLFWLVNEPCFLWRARFLLSDAKFCFRFPFQACMMLITFLPYTVSMSHCGRWAESESNTLLAQTQVKLTDLIRGSLISRVTCVCSSLWWRPSPRTSWGFYSSAVVWWWWASSRWCCSWSYYNSKRKTSLSLIYLQLLSLHSAQHVCACIFITCVSFPVVGDRVVRLQPSVPAERADPDLGAPDLLQTPHPQSHHAGAPHVLHRHHLFLHLLPAGGWHLLFSSTM